MSDSQIIDWSYLGPDARNLFKELTPTKKSMSFSTDPNYWRERMDIFNTCFSPNIPETGGQIEFDHFKQDFKPERAVIYQPYTEQMLGYSQIAISHANCQGRDFKTNNDEGGTWAWAYSGPAHIKWWYSDGVGCACYEGDVTLHEKTLRDDKATLIIEKHGKSFHLQAQPHPDTWLAQTDPTPAGASTDLLLFSSRPDREAKRTFYRFALPPT